MDRVLRFTWVAVGLAAGLAAVAATAQAPQVEQRQALMKQQAAANRVIVPMVRGEQPWNQQAAKQAATTLASTAKQMAALFPASAQGGNALPAVWQNLGDFQAKAKALGDAATRLEAAGDEASFKAAFPAVGQACSGCHQLYRKPQ